MAEPKYGALNVGQNKSYWNKKAIEGITGVAEAQKNIGGVENTAAGIGQAYGGLNKVFDQQQNAGVTGMRQIAGQQFASMAGRGGASNAMASAGVGAANAQMATQMGTFMSDIAAQRAQAAIAGAQAQYDVEKDLYDYRQSAASADLDAAQLFEKSKLFDNLSEDFKKSLEEKANAILSSSSPQDMYDWILSFADPAERKAAYNAAAKALKASPTEPIALGQWEAYQAGVNPWGDS